MCGRVSFDARRAIFFFRPLFGFDFDPTAWACASIPFASARYLKIMCLSCVVGRCVRPLYGHLVPCTRTRQRRRGSMSVRAPRFGRAVELGSGADPPPWRAGGRRYYGATWARVGHPRTTRVSSRSEHAHPGSVSTSRHL